MRLLQKECGKCLRHPFLWIVCITFGLFQFLSIYTYVGNAGMRKELRQMHVAVTDEETASPEFERAYADYKKTYGGMYDTLDMRKILEQKEKMSGYEPQGVWGSWIVRNYDRLQKRVEQIRKTGEGTYDFYPGSWYKLHTTLYGKLWKKLILQTAVLMILSMLYLMDYERIYKTQDLVLATTTGKKMMEKENACRSVVRAVLCRTAYSVYPLGIFCSGSVSEPVACSGGGMHGCRAAAADDVSVCHVLAAGAVALSFACAGGACGIAWDRCGCYCRSAVVFTEQLFFVCGIGSSFYGGISACLCADGKCVGSYPGIL